MLQSSYEPQSKDLWVFIETKHGKARNVGLELLNPGSVGSLERPTYGLVEADNGVFKCTIVDILEETDG